MSYFKKQSVLFLLILFVSSIYSQSDSTTITIMAVGDIMLGTDFPNNRLPNNDGKELLKNVSEILSSADITIGNYEGVLADGGEPHKKCNDTTKCYLYRTPTRYASNLVSAGFDFISIANNHANDFGSPGLNSTQSVLGKANILFSGPVGKVAYKTYDGVKIAFIAFATSSGMHSILNIPEAKNLVTALKKDNDIVIVSFHGGAEGKEALHVTNSMEKAYGEKRGNVIEFAHSVIDAGADLVIGHGPHVPRALDIYKDRLIAFSLGNFCTYEGFNISGVNGLAPILTAEISRTGEFIGGKIFSAKQVRSVGTTPDADQKAYELMRKLTKSDFPKTKISFKNDGSFSPFMNN